MTARRPLTRISGRLKEFPVGDILGGLALLGRRINIEFYEGSNSTPTWTKRPGLSKVWVIGIGLGGTSGGCASTSTQVSRGGGGGQGEMGWSEVLAADLGSTETVTLGSKGAAGTGAGAASGDCSFGSHLILKPGGPGAAGVTNTPGAAGGAGGTGGTANKIRIDGLPGGAGYTVSISTTNYNGQGGGGFRAEMAQGTASLTSNTDTPDQNPLVALLAGPATPGHPSTPSGNAQNGRAGKKYGGGACGAARGGGSTGSSSGAQGGDAAILVIEFYDD